MVLGFCQSVLCKFPKVEAVLPTEDQKEGSLPVFPCCSKASWGTVGVRGQAPCSLPLVDFIHQNNKEAARLRALLLSLTQSRSQKLLFPVTM